MGAAATTGQFTAEDLLSTNTRTMFFAWFRKMRDFVPILPSYQAFSKLTLNRTSGKREIGGGKMPKGYWVVFADLTDPEGYKEYVAGIRKSWPCLRDPAH
jgi:hypothetical protein